MFYPNVIPLIITYLLLPQGFVHGGLGRELCRKFVGFFKSKPRLPALYYDNCNLCTFGPCTPMVLQSNDASFDATNDATKISNSIQSLSTNDMVTVANILMQRSALQRTAIANAFETVYKEPISDKLYEKIGRKKTLFRYYLFIQFMSLPMPQFYDKRFKAAISLQSNQKNSQDQGQAIIVELLTTLPKCLMDKIIESYNSITNQNLIRDLDTALAKANKSPQYREVIKKLVEQKRDTNQRVSWFKALSGAYKLKSAIKSQQENNMKERFSELFIERSVPQIIETIVVYENLRHGDKEFQSLLDDIDKYKGDEKDIYKIMVRLFTNKPLYFAKEIEEILKRKLRGSTFEKRLIYFFVARYDIDLKDIVAAYNRISGTGLRADFEAWDTDIAAEGFHPIILDMIDKASK